jgi:hypothetical protein
VHKIVSEPDRKRLFWRHRHRWEDNIKMDLKKWVVGVWTGFMWLNVGSIGRFL